MKNNETFNDEYKNYSIYILVYINRFLRYYDSYELSSIFFLSTKTVS